MFSEIVSSLAAPPGFSLSTRSGAHASPARRRESKKIVGSSFDLMCRTSRTTRL